MGALTMLCMLPTIRFVIVLMVDSISEMCIRDRYYIGTFNCYSENEAHNQETALESISINQTGEYRLIYETSEQPAGSWGYCIYITSLTLDKTSEVTEDVFQYDFNLINQAYGEDVTKMAYADTGDTWAFDGANSEDIKNLTVHKGYGIGTEASSVGNYISFGTVSYTHLIGGDIETIRSWCKHSFVCRNIITQ